MAIEMKKNMAMHAPPPPGTPEVGVDSFISPLSPFPLKKKRERGKGGRGGISSHGWINNIPKM